MDHRRFFRVLSLLLIFALLAGAFALAEEDVSITIYDNQGNVVAGEGTPVPPEGGEDEAEPLETPEPTRDPFPARLRTGRFHSADPVLHRRRDHRH